MRIIVNGQQAFGKACLEAILATGRDDVVAVYTAPDREGEPVDPLKAGGGRSVGSPSSSRPTTPRPTPWRSSAASTRT